MKYLVIIPSGISDYPCADLDGRTPLQAAETPLLDRLSLTGRMGTATMFVDPDAVEAEITLLAALGYDPREYVAGCGALEALGRGLEARDGLYLRCDLVTIAEGMLSDLAVGHLTETEGRGLLEALQPLAREKNIELIAGDRHRHTAFMEGLRPDARLRLYSPQLALNGKVKRFLPGGRDASALRSFVWEAVPVLDAHDINTVRKDLGENPANGVWVYGAGGLPVAPSFSERYGLRGCIVAGTAVARGCGKLIGLATPDIAGASGLADTNLAAKRDCATEALSAYDIVFVQVEGADETGHAGDVAGKVAFLEHLERDLVAPLLDRLAMHDAWRFMLLPDRMTSVQTRRHEAEPIPFVMSGAGIESNRGGTFDEATAAVGELHVDRGWDLLEYFLKR